MDRFVKPDKGDFLGRDALLAWQEAGMNNLLVTLVVHGVTMPMRSATTRS